MALIDDFKTRFPEIDETLVDEKLPIIELTWPAFYGGTYDQGGDETQENIQNEIILNLVAHLLTVDGKSAKATSNQVASRGTGPLSVSYALPESNEQNSFFSSTKYGQRYTTMIDAQSTGAFFV